MPRRSLAAITRVSSLPRSIWRAYEWPSARAPPPRQAFGTRSRFVSGCIPAGDWRIAQAQSLLGASLFMQKKYSEAEPLMVAADQALKPVPGRQERERLANRERLAVLQERIRASSAVR